MLSIRKPLMLASAIATLGGPGGGGGGSGRTWSASADWLRSDSNKATERNAVSGFWGPGEFGADALPGDFTLDFLLNAVPAGAGLVSIGFGTLAEAAYSGFSAESVGIVMDTGSPADPVVWRNGDSSAGALTGTGAMAAAKSYRFQRTGASVSVKLLPAGTPVVIDITALASAGTVYAHIAQGNNTGFKGTIL